MINFKLIFFAKETWVSLLVSSYSAAWSFHLNPFFSLSWLLELCRTQQLWFQFCFSSCWKYLYGRWFTKVFLEKKWFVRDPGWRGRPWGSSESGILEFSHGYKNPGTSPVNRASFPRRQGLISPSLLSLTSTFLFISQPFSSRVSWKILPHCFQVLEHNEQSRCHSGWADRTCLGV